MKLKCGELHKLSELILRCINSVTNMELCKNQAIDTELKSIIETHLL